MRPLFAPLLVFIPLAAYLGGMGVAQEWIAQTGRPPFWPLEHLLSAALHASWIFAVIRRRGLLAAVVCWLTAFYFCRAGLARLAPNSSALLLTLLLEGIPLLLALSESAEGSLAERLATSRRKRAEISVQLSMGQGLIPWVRNSMMQLLNGRAELPAGTDYYHMSASLADAERRLRLRLGELAFPEQLRQSILACVTALISRSEATAARVSIDFEQQALAAAAQCREQCERLPNVSSQQRRALAAECESLFFGLIRSAQRLSEPPARAAGNK